MNIVFDWEIMLFQSQHNPASFIPTWLATSFLEIKVKQIKIVF